MNFLYYRTLANVLSSRAKASYLRSTMVAWQARNQLETLGCWSAFWEGHKYFELCPTHFSRGRNFFHGGRSLPCAPLVTGLSYITVDWTRWRHKTRITRGPALRSCIGPHTC